MSNPLLAGLDPIHPGEVLREEVIPDLRISKAEMARHLRLSRQSLHDILKGKQAITPAVALKLGRLLGTTPELWLRMQQNYDLRVAERQMVDELEQIPVLQAV
jgi:antitoxin HigA-1